MSLPQSQGYFSVEEYLTLERESEERYEFLDGHVYAMAGESPEHSDVCANLLAYFIHSYEVLPVASGPRIRKSAAVQNPDPAGLRKGSSHIPI
jgi:Uma2 family endonuclease